MTDLPAVAATTCALGYRQEYRRLGPGEHGHRRRVFRVRDGALMYAGPGTGPDHPPERHRDWVALPREERIAVQAVLDAADELTGIADYLSERAGRDALALAARARGVDPLEFTGREADDARREASQAEYELVLGSTTTAALERLAGVLRRDTSEKIAGFCVKCGVRVEVTRDAPGRCPCCDFDTVTTGDDEDADGDDDAVREVQGGQGRPVQDPPRRRPVPPPGSSVRAVVLLSGGLGSTTALSVALRDGRDCHLLCADYGQRHQAEIDSAVDVGDHFGLDVHVVRVPALGELSRSALTSAGVSVPKDRTADQIESDASPPTYVPARTTVLLGLALACAQSIGAREIWVGFDRGSVSYPDRPRVLLAFEVLADVQARDPGSYRIRAPLIDLTKAQVIQFGEDLGVPHQLTHSCYDPTPPGVTAVGAVQRSRWGGARSSSRRLGVGRLSGAACGRCDACVLRRRGFLDADVPDPTWYA